MIASVPSNIALATSETSALVGLGFLIIESNIWVAVTTGFPAALHFSIIIFWTAGNFSNGISTPRSPLATIKPSEASNIASILSTPSWFSILEMIMMCSPPFSFNICLIVSTSEAFLMNDAATALTPISQPNFKSAISFSVKAGNLIETPGTLTPLWVATNPVFWTVQWILFPSIDSTVNPTKPSSIRIVSPGLTSLANPA